MYVCVCVCVWGGGGGTRQCSVYEHSLESSGRLLPACGGRRRQSTLLPRKLHSLGWVEELQDAQSVWFRRTLYTLCHVINRLE